MQRLNRVLTSAAIIGASIPAVAAIADVAGIAAAGSLVPSAFAQPVRAPVSQTARASSGRITGIVSDDRGGPLAGAMVSALGQMIATTVSDTRGFFAIDALPAGEYVVQAHLSGFAGSQRQLVYVGGVSASVQLLQLRRLNTPVATSGTQDPVAARPIMSAGFGLPNATLADQPDDSAKPEPARDEHPHTETAWRLRHIKRSILKNTAPVVAFADPEPDIPEGSLFGRAVYSAANLATAFFTDLPFSGEVNVLTTSVFRPGELFSGDQLPRNVAYLVIGAPTPAGEWSVRAAISQGDVSSWIVAGAFSSRNTSADGYQFGLTYGKQEYLGGNPAALAAMGDGSRNVGEVYAFDRRSLLPALSFEYGGRYARYDYLQRDGLLSPTLGITVEPLPNTRVTATVAQRMLAPGAEEFLASERPGPWLPPERTFAPLGSPSSPGAFRVERTRSLDVRVEHEFEDLYVLGLRRFYQNVDDQLVTLFGLDRPEGPESVGHYYVASAGALDADGWAVRLSSPPGKRLRACVDYSMTHARWLSRGDAAQIEAWAPTAVRPDRELLHDVTTSVETEIPETATRVFVLYKFNSGYTRSDPEATRPGPEGRFDVQVNQALPFALGGTRWELLIGIRNLFRDVRQPGSVYDELLVVRPPKRVVGGFLVRF
jgi:outer membrane receptor protein involved in Fe transport